MKRIVKTLLLKDNPILIEKYCKIHEKIWPEVREGIKDSGISNMEIFLQGRLAVMLVEISENLDENEVFKKLAEYPRQKEWEEYVAQFQECNKDDSSAEKWKVMSKIFTLNNENS